MKFLLSNLFNCVIIVALISCAPRSRFIDVNKPDNASTDVKVDVSKSAVIPRDGSTPIAGSNALDNPSRVVTFSNIGQKIDVKNGETVNFVYDGIDPESTYIIYESTDDGYTLELAVRDQPVAIYFTKMCQNFIVANPSLTIVNVPDNLKFEQIVWTPRSDGTWEVRVGAVERGCKSPALNHLNKLRNKNYEKNLPK
ncbi:MAG: hypothetical protein NT007_16650 [Candidatus Kapabacteria bacterium]|nr:hypothetical protein [Candidatus Kapabacteria bacterium]